MGPIGSADELSDNADLVALPLHAAFEHVANAESFSDLAHIQIGALELEG